MSSPTPPADGQFVTSDDVVARFDGVFPSDRVTWVKWRILDAENELVRLVPSLQTINVNADPDSSEGRRVRSVRTLIVDKILDLHYNPRGSTSVTSGMDGFSTTYGYAQNRTSGRGAGIAFTEEDLNRVRLPKRRRPKIGTYGVAPWNVPC